MRRLTGFSSRSCHRGRLTDILNITKIDGHEVRAAPPRTWMPLLVLLDVRLTSSSSWARCARWHLAPAAHGSILETTGRFVIQQHGSSAVPDPTPPQPAALSRSRAAPGPARPLGRAGRGARPGRASPPPTVPTPRADATVRPQFAALVPPRSEPIGDGCGAADRARRRGGDEAQQQK